MNESVKESQIEAILESLRGGATKTDACKAAGVGRTTFYDWLKADETLGPRVEEAQAEAIEIVEGSLFKAATTPNKAGTYNTVAQIFFLCNKAPDRFKNVKDIRHSGGISVSEREAALAAVVEGGEPLEPEEAPDGSE